MSRAAELVVSYADGDAREQFAPIWDEGILGIDLVDASGRHWNATVPSDDDVVGHGLALSLSLQGVADERTIDGEGFAAPATSQLKLRFADSASRDATADAIRNGLLRAIQLRDESGKSILVRFLGQFATHAGVAGAAMSGFVVVPDVVLEYSDTTSTVALS